MIVGGARWDNPTTWYLQTNDMLEEILGKLGVSHILQSCGPNSAASCMEAAGHDLTTITRAGYSIPADDLITEFCNNSRNYDLFKAVGINPHREPNNRHAKLYPIVVKALWGIKAEWLSGFQPQHLPPFLEKGITVQVCLKDPGHYIAVVAYDKETREFIANDSWPTRRRWPTMNGNGFNIRLNTYEVASIVAEAVAYFPPGG